MGVIQIFDGFMNNLLLEGWVDDILWLEGDNLLLEKGFVIISVDVLLNWVCIGLMWLMIFGLVCCVVEMMYVGVVCLDFDCYGVVFCLLLC